MGSTLEMESSAIFDMPFDMATFFRIQDAVLLDVDVQLKGEFEFEGKQWLCSRKKFNTSSWLCEDGRQFSYGLCSHLAAIGKKVAVLTSYGGWGWGDSNYIVADFKSIASDDKIMYKCDIDDMFVDYISEVKVEGDDDNIIRFTCADHIVGGQVCDGECKNCDDETVIYSITYERMYDKYVLKDVFIEEEICRNELDVDDDGMTVPIYVYEKLQEYQTLISDLS